MSRLTTITDFELRVLKFYEENAYTSLLEATSEFCEKHDVDYDLLSLVVKFTDVFKIRLAYEANQLKLLDREDVNEPKFDV